ncbi:Ureidoglycolate lyase [compost metagenome]|uniref:fumarylacetoacetate hydrolase family protein n=1 Tax=Variovorax boronicumulans TaxID=436515 RepID=UPI000FBD883C
MKLCSVLLDGRAAFGALVDNGFVDLSAALEGRCDDLRDLFAKGLVDEARALVRQGPQHSLDRIRFQRPIPNLDARMFGLGWAYKDHQIETGKEAPEHPFMFNKLPQSMVGHEEPMYRPWSSERYDFEGEIVVVIGKPGRHITPQQAGAHIAGYSIMMDGSLRDWQQHSVTAGKNFDSASAYGPCIVTPDELGAPSNMQLTTRLNGNTVQHTAFELMAWKIEDLVAYISTFTRLEAGDSISTGTPGGVGHKRNPQLFMRAGDVLEIEVSGIGTLRNRIEDEPAA